MELMKKLLTLLLLLTLSCSVEQPEIEQVTQFVKIDAHRTNDIASILNRFDAPSNIRYSRLYIEFEDLQDIHFECPEETYPTLNIYEAINSYWNEIHVKKRTLNLNGNIINFNGGSLHYYCNDGQELFYNGTLQFNNELTHFKRLGSVYTNIINE